VLVLVVSVVSVVSVALVLVVPVTFVERPHPTPSERESERARVMYHQSQLFHNRRLARHAAVHRRVIDPYLLLVRIGVDSSARRRCGARDLPFVVFHVGSFTFVPSSQACLRGES
jgi:hypothetical protein